MNFRDRKIQVIIAVVVLITVLISYRIVANIMASNAKAKNSAQGQAITVATGHPVRKTIVPKLRFSGSLDPVWQADVAAKVDGRLEQVYVKEGERVGAGQALALLEQTDISATVLNAKGAYVDAQTNLEKAQRDLGRYERLYQQGAVAQATLDNYQFAVKNAQGKLDAAQGNLDAAEAKMKGTTVTTPRAGIIQKRYYQEGYYAKLGTALFNIADISTLLAKISVPEGYINEIAVGGTVSFTVPSITTGNNKFQGSITRISPVAEAGSRSFEAEVAVDNASGLLHGGVYADALITARPKPDALVIPLTAIVMRDDQRSVYVVQDGVAVRRILATGYIGDNEVEVLSGITEADEVVTGGQNKIREGSKIPKAEKGAN